MAVSGEFSVLLGSRGQREREARCDWLKHTVVVVVMVVMVTLWVAGVAQGSHVTMVTTYLTVVVVAGQPVRTVVASGLLWVVVAVALVTAILKKKSQIYIH